MSNELGSPVLWLASMCRRIFIMFAAVVIENLINNIDEKSDNLLLNYNKNRIKRKIKRILIVKNNFKYIKRRPIPKTENYFDIIKNYQEDEFQSNFGMLQSTFAALKNSLKPFWTTALRGRLGYSLEKCLYITLWKLCNSDVTFRKLGNRFNVAKGTIHKIFYRTVELICLLKSEIIWPSALHQQTVMEHFQNKLVQFPSVIGCVNGTHFNISMPRKEADRYYNRKENYTIILQAISDSNFRFLDVFIGCPGSCNNAHVWKISPIFNGIISNQVKLAENAIILGDETYPLSKFLMTPYRDTGDLSAEEQQFNHCISSAKAFVDQAFELLRNKFKILKNIHLVSIDKASKVIYACTILHNFIINRENSLECNISIVDDSNWFSNEEMDSNSICIDENESDFDGAATRNTLKALFF